MPKMQNHEKAGSGNVFQDSSWDTLYRDYAVENNMSAAMRFQAEKQAQEAKEKDIDFEEIEWYKDHPEKIGDLIEGEDPDKEQWYREHPDKIDQLIAEKNKRKKIEVNFVADENTAHSAEADTTDSVVDVPQPTEADVADAVTDVAEPLSGGEDELFNADIVEEEDDDGREERFTDEDKDRLVGKLAKAVDEGKMSLSHAQSLTTNHLGRSLGTPEEQKAYNEWLEKHDEENMNNLERTGRKVEDSHVVYEIENEEAGDTAREKEDDGGEKDMAEEIIEDLGKKVKDGGLNRENRDRIINYLMGDFEDKEDKEDAKDTEMSSEKKTEKLFRIGQRLRELATIKSNAEKKKRELDRKIKEIESKRQAKLDMASAAPEEPAAVSETEKAKSEQDKKIESAERMISAIDKEIARILGNS